MASKPTPTQLMKYRIDRGETGVFSSSPPNAYYKSVLLPHWRFATVPLAQASSQALWDMFLQYGGEGDFVGMDMCRKYLQMGMTRAARYANYKGGRKYENGNGNGSVDEVGKSGRGRGRVVKSKSDTHEGKEEKQQASMVFRVVWEKCREHEGYLELKKKFLNDQKAWVRKMKVQGEILNQENE